MLRHGKSHPSYRGDFLLCGSERQELAVQMKKCVVMNPIIKV